VIGAFTAVAASENVECFENSPVLATWFLISYLKCIFMLWVSLGVLGCSCRCCIL